MLEMVKTLFNLGTDLVMAAFGVVFSIMSASLDLLVLLHNDMPRLEGLLVGAGLYWVMLNRDKYRVLKIISSPIKLLLDIVQLALDQSKEAFLDILGVVKSSFSMVKRKSFEVARGVWSRLISMLNSLKNKLSK